MLSAIANTGAGQAAVFLILATVACVALVSIVLFAWGLGLHAQEYLAKRAYRRERDARRKLERDLRQSQPTGHVRRAG